MCWLTVVRDLLVVFDRLVIPISDLFMAASRSISASRIDGCGRLTISTVDDQDVAVSDFWMLRCSTG